MFTIEVVPILYMSLLLHLKWPDFYILPVGQVWNKTSLCFPLHFPGSEWGWISFHVYILYSWFPSSKMPAGVLCLPLNGLSGSFLLIHKFLYIFWIHVRSSFSYLVFTLFVLFVLIFGINKFLILTLFALFTFSFLVMVFLNLLPSFSLNLSM